MKIPVLLFTLVAGLACGSIVTWNLAVRKYERMYPPELMNVLASNTELLKPMTKEELADLKKGIKGYLALFSKEWDILTFAEGKLANEFCRILDKEGSDAARRHAISRLVAFRGRYGRGLEISEGWSKVAKALYENSNYAEIEQKAASDHH